MSARKMIQGLTEAVEHAKGRPNGAIEYKVGVQSIDVRAVRERLKLSQEEFATRFGFSLGTLRGWEQGRRQPDGPTRILLRVIMSDPTVVERAVKQA
jgi:putative transcriptional regulator